MDLTDIIYSNDYINILIQNYVAQSERYQMLFPESSALLTLNSQYSVLFLERSLLPENLFGAVPFTGLPKLFTPLSTLWKGLDSHMPSVASSSTSESVTWSALSPFIVSVPRASVILKTSFAVIFSSE